MYIYTICACNVYIYAYIRMYVYTYTFPSQVGTAPAAHGALQAMDPKRSWQCTWRCGKSTFRLVLLFELLCNNRGIQIKLCTFLLKIQMYTVYVYVYIYNSYRLFFLYLFIVFTNLLIFYLLFKNRKTADLNITTLHGWQWIFKDSKKTPEILRSHPHTPGRYLFGTLKNGFGKMMGVTSPSLCFLLPKLVFLFEYPPEVVTCRPWKYTVPKRKCLSSNHHFSGVNSLLNNSGV